MLKIVAGEINMKAGGYKVEIFFLIDRYTVKRPLERKTEYIVQINYKLNKRKSDRPFTVLWGLNQRACTAFLSFLTAAMCFSRWVPVCMRNSCIPVGGIVLLINTPIQYHNQPSLIICFD